MGWGERITERLEPDICMHAVGQGALAVECRQEDVQTLAILSALHHRYFQHRAHYALVLRALAVECRK
jgi:porphobilinogen deaminase